MANSLLPQSLSADGRKAIVDLLPIFKKNTEELQARLAAPILDGTPYIVLFDMPSATEGVGPMTMVYGQWAEFHGGKSCYRSLSIVPNSMCGLLMTSEEGAKRHVAALVQDGRVNARYVHWRVEAQIRLDRNLETIALFEKALANAA
jgi:hypothetical protein